MTNPYELELPLPQIISTANELLIRGQTGASTGEQIAAAFVLNEQKYLPEDYPDLIEAWERLQNWQAHVKTIKSNYMHLINPS